MGFSLNFGIFYWNIENILIIVINAAINDVLSYAKSDANIIRLLVYVFIKSRIS